MKLVDETGYRSFTLIETSCSKVEFNTFHDDLKPIQYRYYVCLIALRRAVNDIRYFVLFSCACSVPNDVVQMARS